MNASRLPAEYVVGAWPNVIAVVMNASKATGAMRTIGELSAETGIPHHVLRYWETRFPQLRPLTRAGNRRYYRPEDVALVRRINALLNDQGYTIRGVQQLLAAEGKQKPAPPPAPPNDSAPHASLIAIRDLLVAALAADTGSSSR